jgi:S1-C subfamily serine protease
LSVNRLINGMITRMVFAVCLAIPGGCLASGLDGPPPFIPLQLHPATSLNQQVDPTTPTLPSVQAPGNPAVLPRGGQIALPSNTPSEATSGVDRSGTGFFIGADGTMLTAAHVVEDCGRLQVVSKYVPRSWVSLLALDKTHDIALLRMVESATTSYVRLAVNAPSSPRLLVLGYPMNAGLTDPAESWVELENHNFPPRVGPLANPRAMLWMSAPLVTHGFSGGPIFDPVLDAVVGIVKGQVDGGYLRLLRDMPTSGIIIGPGTGDIGAFLKEEARYSPASIGQSTGAVNSEAGLAAVKRATVHVLCWK